MLPTVRAILANPRYTGRQVWNRQRTDHDLIDAANTTLGRMESHWAHRPAYRCRHGHTSTTQPAPGRSPNAYLREDHVLPHLPALLLRLTDHHAAPDGAELLALLASAAPLSPADVVAHLRSEAISLTYDPAARSLTADTPRAERITIR